MFFRACYDNADASKETLWVAHLDDLSRCIHLSQHHGDSASAPFPLKSILRDVLERESASLLLAHNHPSGDPRPSDSDCCATGRLVVVADALDCTVLDHLVFTVDDCASFRVLGLL